MKHIISLLIVSVVSASSVSAALQGYWNMDAATVAGKEGAPNLGDASVSGQFVQKDVGFLGLLDPSLAGTNDNELTPNSDVRSIGIYHGGSIYHDGGFQMDNFMFSGFDPLQESISVSFAYRTENVLTLSENLYVEWRINSSANLWNFVEVTGTTSNNWQAVDIDIGNLFTSSDDVDIRIVTEEWFSGFGYLDLDNVQVNVVPEPATWAALLGAGVLGLAFWRRRRRS